MSTFPGAFGPAGAPEQTPADRATAIRAVLALCAMTQDGKPYRMPIALQIGGFAACALQLREILTAVLRRDEAAVLLAHLICDEDLTQGAKP